MTEKANPDDDAPGLLKVLRRQGDEAQLTQLLAAVAQTGDVARQLAVILLAAAPESDAKTSALPVPEDVTCRAEASLLSADERNLGRVDLRFDSAEGDFTLLVELKLYSPYSHDQVGRYSEALAALPRDRRSGLLAITRNLPTAGEPAAGTPGWLGSVRWTDIYDPLLALDVGNKQLAVQWRLLLALIYDQGDFGMTELEAADVRGWANYASTRDKLEDIIEGLAPQALDVLRTDLGEREHWRQVGFEGRASLVTRSLQQKAARPTKTTVQANFRVPGDGAESPAGVAAWERLRVQFLGGFGDPIFAIEARRSGARRLLDGDATGAAKFREAVTYLKGLDPAFKTDGRSYVTRTHGSREWLAPQAGQTVHQRLLTIVTDDISALVASGILDPDSGFEADLGVTVEEESLWE